MAPLSPRRTASSARSVLGFTSNRSGTPLVIRPKVPRDRRRCCPSFAAEVVPAERGVSASTLAASSGVGVSRAVPATQTPPPGQQRCRLRALAVASALRFRDAPAESAPRWTLVVLSRRPPLLTAATALTSSRLAARREGVRKAEQGRSGSRP